MKPIRQIPSPYGILVNMYSQKDVHNPEQFVFDLEGTAIMAGIYDPTQRKRFAEFVKKNGSLDPSMLKEFGGGTCPSISLARPREPITPTLPKDAQQDIPLEVWVDQLLEISAWSNRAKWFEQTIADNLDVTVDYLPFA